METLGHLAHGFSVAFTPVNLMWCLLGTTLGTAIGVLPGLGPALTIALLLPITYQVAPEASFILFAGIYYGAMYGGSTTSILLNTPGESATIVTALEGNRMARSGRGGAALATSAIGSFVAGTLGTLGVAFLAPVVVKFALSFGLVGVDLQTGQPRFTFGMSQLLDGVDVIVVAVGLFAVGETLYMASRRYAGKDEIVPLRGSLYMTAAEWARSWKAWLRGTLLGFPIGALPAGGAEIPTFLSYAIEKKLSKHKEEFGTVGAIEGVAGPEAANNASAAGVLVPMLTLGLPTSATAAIMLSAFQSYGINPGPMLFMTQANLVWGLIASLFIANVILVILNLPLIGLWVRLLKIPAPQLYAGILVFATVGTYGISQSPTDLVILYLLGGAGFLMRRFDFPTAPVIIGMILWPLAEAQFRRAMTISNGDWSVFYKHPLSLTLLTLAFIGLIGPHIWAYVERRRTRGPEHVPGDA
ncbi:MAG: tripartite tricarboxylate transporter permease [Mesorhizobium sp.]|nr:MAG: tripartite tricarboxylate transporter permease [Mesorhizobium sp.]